MTSADRAEWLARVDAMTRGERLMAMADACSAVAHAALKAKVDLCYVHPGCDDMGERIAQMAILDALSNGRRALDLIDALERDAAAEALHVGDRMQISTALIEHWREDPLNRSGIARVVKIERECCLIGREGGVVVLWLQNDAEAQP